PFFTWESLRPQFKNITIRLFEKSSHTPQLEEAENFDRVLLEWLNR
nr:alpha/beta hydrolase [Candidatus Dependentiae bacterium]